MKYLTPIEMIANWVNFKEKVPAINKTQDKWYGDKIYVLLHGISHLDNKTYSEWGKDIESIFESIDGLSQETKSERQIAVLILIGWLYIGASEGKEPPTSEQNNVSQYDLSIEILHRIIFILYNYTSEYITLFLQPDLNDDVLNKFNGHSKHNDVVKAIIQTLHDYPHAISEIYKGNYSPLSLLIKATFQIQEDYAYAVAQDSRGQQQRKAAQIKNEPNRKTKMYAISLYEKGEWPNPRAASISLTNEVMKFGEENNRRFNDQYSAQARIYEWLRSHDKSK